MRDPRFKFAALTRGKNYDNAFNDHQSFVVRCVIVGEKHLFEILAEILIALLKRPSTVISIQPDL